ncbi:hypothetical protein [uncultured Maribacter sp.]|uniref:hypothetical protein n=1 Tax=uncultured Maribacter sp. TaxID=431308 RepID=UPI0030ED4C4E|tara:strand:+ start:4017 stop:5141 length:1125 start_codon:yes stop_codon:yes gene_type:complete
MKTYNIVAYLFMALSFSACEKSSVANSEEVATVIPSNYTVFLSSSNHLNTVVLGSSDDGLEVQNSVTSFTEIPSKYTKFRTSDEISFYYTKNCEAKIQVYNAKSDIVKSYEVFKDFDPCSIDVIAITHTEQSIFIAYERELQGKDKQNTVRVVPLNTNGNNSIDIPLDKKPVDLITSTNRLFVLTLNEFVTDEYHLSVVDLNTNELLMEIDLGRNVAKLFKNNAEQIIISNPKLHTTLDPVTLDKTYTTYGENTEPGFLTTKDSFIDSAGKMYFQKTMQTSGVTSVPAIYNFQENSTVVYLFENFLSESELNVKYSIASTTSIGYDELNDFVLIGYQKKGNSNKGGILRISPAPEFKIIDNIDLDGVPQTIFVN